MFDVAVYNPRRHYQIRISSDEPVVLGSQPGVGPLALHLDEDAAFRQHLRLQASGNKMRLENLAGYCWTHEGRRLDHRAAVEFQGPFQCSIGWTTVECLPEGCFAFGPAASTFALGDSHDADSLISPKLLGKAPSAGTLGAWFAALSKIQRAAAGSSLFFETAAAAICDPGGLDAGMVLLFEEGDWMIAASRIVRPELGVAFRRDVLEQVVAERRGLFHESGAVRAAETAEGFRAVAVCPFFNSEGEIAGVVYGSRTSHRMNQRMGVRPLEAQWVGLVADALGTGVARLHSEAESTRRRVLLEQAFSPEVAHRIEHDPRVLEPSRREVTLLFADLRGSTRLAETLTASQLYRLLSDLLERLTQEVMLRGGVVLDYYGDGLAAMWNAPSEQPDHALRALLATQGMLAAVPSVSEAWASVLSQPLEIGVGLHAGEVLVGNAGSQRRLKYGPRGPAVHLAARIEAACKELQSACLLSDAVAERLPSQVVLRRVCRAKLRGSQTAFNLYEPIAVNASEVDAALIARVKQYEQALSDFEHGDVLQTLAAIDEISAELNRRPRPTFSVEPLRRRAREQVNAAPSIKRDGTWEL